MNLFNGIKTIFLLTVFAYVAPNLFEKIKKDYTPLVELRTNIGVITIDGPIETSYQLAEELHIFFKNPLIKAVIIKINCSQSPIGTSQTIFHEIRQLKKDYPKPIITLVENSCTGGAYLIASACDYIIAPESSIIAGIGKFTQNNTAELSEEEKTSLHIRQADIYQQITKQIATARKLSLTTVANWAEEKTFTGNQAVSLGLINEVGSLCTVIKVIKEKALIDNEIEWVKSKNAKSY